MPNRCVACWARRASFAQPTIALRKLSTSYVEIDMYLHSVMVILPPLSDREIERCVYFPFRQ